MSHRIREPDFAPSVVIRCAARSRKRQKAANAPIIPKTQEESINFGRGSMTIELDGSFGEGGGQILRTSLALSLLTGKAFHLTNVRAGRAKPGLQPQHLMSVRAAATIGGAQVQGANLHSTDLVFEPGPITAGKFHFPIGTAGAVGLVLHTLYLPLALRGTAPSELTLEGGTHVSASPCFHFLDVTWRLYLERLGVHVNLQMRRPGFYPRGGGVVVAHVLPCQRLNGLQCVERKPVTTVLGFSAVAGLPEEIAARQKRRAVNRLKRSGLTVDLDQQRWEGGPGTVLGLILDTQPAPTLFFSLGARSKPAERVADEAADQALAYLEAEQGAVDSHSADQLLLPLAMAENSSTFTVSEATSHLLTNVTVIRCFLDREIICEGEEGETGTVRIL
jgi:RNA 3'-terminal phosphate cyclase (ATP)